MKLLCLLTVYEIPTLTENQHQKAVDETAQKPKFS